MGLNLDDITKCPEGYEYRLGDVQCITAPCPQVMGCYPVTTSTTTTTTTLVALPPITGVITCGDGTKALPPAFHCQDVNGVNTSVATGPLCPQGTYWDGMKCSLIIGNPSVPTLPNGQPAIPYGGNELPIAINCRNANGTFDYTTGMCIPNVPAPAPTLPSGQEAVVTNPDNTQKYLMYGVVGLLAYSILIKK